jgi:alpha-L-arabinofuranosidase
VSAAISDDGTISLAVVNVHETQNFSTKIEGLPDGKVADIYTVTGPDIGAVNTEDKSDVLIAESRWEANGAYEFPKTSMTMLRWKA